MAEPRLITGATREDDAPDATLRPQLLADFVGQAQACANLSPTLKYSSGIGGSG